MQLKWFIRGWMGAAVISQGNQRFHRLRRLVIVTLSWHKQKILIMGLNSTQNSELSPIPPVHKVWKHQCSNYLWLSYGATRSRHDPLVMMIIKEMELASIVTFVETKEQISRLPWFLQVQFCLYVWGVVAFYLSVDSAVSPFYLF